jgi:cytochrome c553
MKSRRVLFLLTAIVSLAGTVVFAADMKSTNVVVATTPVYVPNVSHANDPLPDGVLVWDTLLKAMDAAADQSKAQFTFNFTNVSPDNVVILNVKPSCGCTTAQLPSLPWTIPASTSGQIGITVNLEGKSGMLFKTIAVTTDKGSKTLNVRINILPVVKPQMTEADRTKGIAAAKVDRQAIFKGDCASCHVKNVEGKYAKDLYDSVCGICHEAEHRATMVPDLHALKVPTNEDFWRTWISNGKPGTLMAAFASSQGGPLNDMQIASLAAYLNYIIPSHVPPVPQ